MNMRALKVGQHVTLSDALPGEISKSEVIEVTKWYVAVGVNARLDGVDGFYLVHFNYDGSVLRLYPWIDASTPGWDGWATWGPIPQLRIIDPKEEETKCTKPRSCWWFALPYWWFSLPSWLSGPRSTRPRNPHNSTSS
jgi:hypothetical protein